MPETWRSAYLTDDGLVKTGPGVVHMIIIGASGASSYADIYDGVDTGGTLIAKLRCPNAYSLPFLLDVAFGVGLYVDFGSANLQSATVIYR